MTNPRIGLYDGNMVMMFPRRLMNTAVSATLFKGSDYARHIENILPNAQKAGSGAKRYGFGTKGALIASVNVLDIMEYRTSAGEIKFLVYLDDGSIRILNESTGAYTSLVSGLAANGNPRWVSFNEKLIICDGVNPLMAYNGSTLEAIKEWVKDYDSVSGGLASAASQTDTNTVIVTIGSGRSDYEVGQRIRVTFATAGAVIATISAVSGTTTKTIDVSGTPFPDPNETITRVEYEQTAPAFSDIYVEHNRLWALSEGLTKASVYRASTDAMKVFYTDTTNNESTWVNATTQEVGYVNLINKSRRFDELVRITSIDSYLVFFGRNQTFIYGGDDPTTAGGLIWQKTLPVGCINGNLVIKYPADVFFFTRYGARSLRTVFLTEGQEIVADIASDVDPTVTSMVSTMTGSDAVFRAARAFFYERDGFYGFKLGGSYILANALNVNSAGWVYLSGLFKDATAYYGTSDGRLLIAKAGQMYAYANGTDNDGGTGYADDGATYLVKWWSPWLKLRAGRWHNVAFEVMMEEVADTTLDIYWAVDENDATTISTPATVSLTEDSAYWDEAFWDDSKWDGVKKRVIERAKFLCDSFFILIQNESTLGPISFLGVRPIGK